MSRADRSIALVGLRGAGKTTVGRRLAQLLDLSFVDLDVALAALEGSGRSAGELLAGLGEPAFRELEARALARVLAGAEPVVLATGGGAVLRAESRELLSARCRCVWLDAPVEVLAARLAADSTSRPALTELEPLAELERLAAERRELYETLAELVVDSSTADEVVLASSLAARLSG